MKPITILPTHERLAITRKNIELLLPYTEIVLVVSDVDEFEFYSHRFQSNIYPFLRPNKPLGKKFQAGVDYARQLPHDCIVISGSDDILSKNFWEKIVPKSKTVSFIGFRSWYIYHQGKLYWLDYMAAESLPLGSGRIYSREFLEKVDYQIFDSTKNIWLDNFGWKKAAEDGDFLLLHSPEILAVKGDWNMLNKFNPKHKNVNIRAEYSGWKAKEIMKEKFGYEVPPDPPKVYHLR